jgi:type III restriction enzyme
MKIKFDPNQRYQLEAIFAVTDLFDGQSLAGGSFEARLSGTASELLTELGVGNSLRLGEDRLLENLRGIQRRHGIAPVEELQGMHFSVEMETGTGKTYVYLRTIHELRKRYGFKKFIIVVPSVAIREGVQKNLEITGGHFRDIYGHVPLDSWVYDSRNVSRLRQFAGSNQVQVLIINIDAFNKAANNVIHRENDRLSGRNPIEFIQAARPIVILDEPQNMESSKARKAIQSLNPMCTLRYSATHRHLHNLLYRLDPVRAYDLKLVKRIEVDAVLDDPDFNRPYVHLKSIEAKASGITARLDVDVATADGPKRKPLAIKGAGVDLKERTGRDVYEGYVIEEINAAEGFVSFSNGVSLGLGDVQGGYTDEVMRVQVHETVKEHFEKELRVRRNLPEGRRLKVLSLFFIDRVSNYTGADGKIRRWFTEAYQELAARSRYSVLRLPPVERVHNGYFAQRQGVAQDTSGRSQADDDAYALIMQDKERLLALDEPLRFIFSHSALREGWDNPNVFQICTLNETRSEIKKRQEIGRGMRLPVLETGERCFDEAVNRLTVIANESYHDFARALQQQIEDECGVVFGENRIKNKRERREIRLRKGWNLNPEFRALWDRIKHQTRYSVEYDSGQLVDSASRTLRTMPQIKPPSIQVLRAGIDITEDGVSPTVQAVREAAAAYKPTAIPDLLGALQRETELTRRTLVRILTSSKRLGEVATNPQQFLEQAGRAIRATLNQMIIDGIKYERIEGAEYEMMLFEQHEVLGYLNRVLPVRRSIFDAIEFDSDVERRFAEALDSRSDIRLFIKLPGWFKVTTPLGEYNPDWAIVKQAEGEEERLYLVRETKGSTDMMDLRSVEAAKLRCGQAHFDSLDVNFRAVTNATDV